jgi:hypothetical protein
MSMALIVQPKTLGEFLEVAADKKGAVTGYHYPDSKPHGNEEGGTLGGGYFREIHAEKGSGKGKEDNDAGDHPTPKGNPRGDLIMFLLRLRDIRVYPLQNGILKLRRRREKTGHDNFPDRFQFFYFPGAPGTKEKMDPYLRPE